MVFRWHNRFHHRMRIIRADPLRQKTDPLRHTVNVRIHRKRRTHKGKTQHNRRGLRSYAMKAGQPCFRLVQRHISKKVDVQFAALSINPAQHFLNPRTFLVRQPRRLDRRDHRVCRRVHHRFPRRESRFQRRESAVTVRVSRALAQNTVDQFIQRGQERTPVREAKELSECSRHRGIFRLATLEIWHGDHRLNRCSPSASSLFPHPRSFRLSSS